MSIGIQQLRAPIGECLSDDSVSDEPGPGLRIISSITSVILLTLGLWLSQQGDGRHIDPGLLLQFAAAGVATAPLALQLVKGLRRPAGDEFTDQLVVLAIFGAVAEQDYFTAVLVPVVMDLGHILEQRGIRGTQAAIDGLKKLSARSAVVIDTAGEHLIAPDEIRVGDTLLLRPGDILAADGIVSQGQGALDESSITGESLPREIVTGDRVHAGSLNIDGLLRVRVTGTGTETTLGKVRAMLAVAIRSKSPLIRLLERYAEFYVPVVLLLAAFVFFSTRELNRVIAVFVVSCPCALILSGPSAMIAALACAARHGVLIKNTKFLETLAEADTVVFDKTGTLTHGQLEVVGVHELEGCSRLDLLTVAMRCASASTHPISRAIARYGASQNIRVPTDPLPVRESSGEGVEVLLGDCPLRLGRLTWLATRGIKPPDPPSHPGPLVCVADGDTLRGFILLSDTMRTEAATAVKDLRNIGISRIVLLTGDREIAASAISRALGCDLLIAEALPQGKHEAVQRERAQDRTVIVVGDGINDALALAAGDVGIAMGGRGSDIAIQSADIALMANDLRCVSFAVRLARQTRQIMKQNVAIAFSYALLMLGLSSIGTLSALTGALLHNVGTAAVLLNSARLIRTEPSRTVLS